jgi:hypothetical protein
VVQKPGSTIGITIPSSWLHIIPFVNLPIHSN